MCPCVGWDSYDETKAKTDCYRTGNVQTFNVETDTDTAVVGTAMALGAGSTQVMHTD